jgi:putative peptide zinc metalloprotease protein
VQGPVVDLGAYAGRNVVLWFSRGFTCPFCRRYMAQLSLAYDRYRAADAEIIQIGPDLLTQARLFFRTYRLHFPFLCDTEKNVFRAYGLHDLGPMRAMADTVISFSTALARGEFQRTFYASWLDTFATGLRAPARLAEHGLHEVPQGMFAIDRTGVVRYARVFGPLENIPGNDELLRVVGGLPTPEAQNLAQNTAHV